MTPAISGKKYELMLIFHPALTETEVQKELDTIKTLIQKDGALFHEQIWGKRDLYYMLNGQEKGIYAVLDFTSSGQVQGFSKELKLMHHVLRSLLLELPQNYEIKPFGVVEEDKPRRSDRDRKFTPRPGTRTPVALPEERQEPVAPAEKVVAKAAEPVEPAVPETAAAVPEEEPKLKPKKDKKSNFDDKIDEIIENLDKL